MVCVGIESGMNRVRILVRVRKERQKKKKATEKKRSYRRNMEICRARFADFSSELKNINEIFTRYLSGFDW